MQSGASVPEADLMASEPPISELEADTPSSSLMENEAKPKKGLLTRAMRKIVKTITAPERDASGQRIPLSSSISRRLGSGASFTSNSSNSLARTSSRSFFGNKLNGTSQSKSMIEPASTDSWVGNSAPYNFDSVSSADVHAPSTTAPLTTATGSYNSLPASASQAQANLPDQAASLDELVAPTQGRAAAEPEDAASFAQSLSLRPSEFSHSQEPLDLSARDMPAVRSPLAQRADAAAPALALERVVPTSVDKVVSDGGIAATHNEAPVADATDNQSSVPVAAVVQGDDSGHVAQQTGRAAELFTGDSTSDFAFSPVKAVAHDEVSRRPEPDPPAADAAPAVTPDAAAAPSGKGGKASLEDDVRAACDAIFAAVRAVKGADATVHPSDAAVADAVIRHSAPAPAAPESRWLVDDSAAEDPADPALLGGGQAAELLAPTDAPAADAASAHPIDLSHTSAVISSEASTHLADAHAAAQPAADQAPAPQPHPIDVSLADNATSESTAIDAPPPAAATDVALEREEGGTEAAPASWTPQDLTAVAWPDAPAVVEPYAISLDSARGEAQHKVKPDAEVAPAVPAKGTSMADVYGGLDAAAAPTQPAPVADADVVEDVVFPPGQGASPRSLFGGSAINSSGAYINPFRSGSPTPQSQSPGTFPMTPAQSFASGMLPPTSSFASNTYNSFDALPGAAALQSGRAFKPSFTPSELVHALPAGDDDGPDAAEPESHALLNAEASEASIDVVPPADVASGPLPPVAEVPHAPGELGVDIADTSEPSADVADASPPSTLSEAPNLEPLGQPIADAPEAEGTRLDALEAQLPLVSALEDGAAAERSADAPPPISPEAADTDEPANDAQFEPPATEPVVAESSADAPAPISPSAGAVPDPAAAASRGEADDDESGDDEAQVDPATEPAGVPPPMEATALGIVPDDVFLTTAFADSGALSAQADAEEQTGALDGLPEGEPEGQQAAAVDPAVVPAGVPPPIEAAMLGGTAEELRRFAPACEVELPPPVAVDEQVGSGAMTEHASDAPDVSPPPPAVDNDGEASGADPALEPAGVPPPMEAAALGAFDATNGQLALEPLAQEPAPAAPPAAAAEPDLAVEDPAVEPAGVPPPMEAAALGAFDAADGQLALEPLAQEPAPAAPPAAAAEPALAVEDPAVVPAGVPPPMDAALDAAHADVSPLGDEIEKAPAEEPAPPQANGAAEDAAGGGGAPADLPTADEPLAPPPTPADRAAASRDVVRQASAHASGVAQAADSPWSAPSAAAATARDLASAPAALEGAALVPPPRFDERTALSDSPPVVADEPAEVDVAAFVQPPQHAVVTSEPTAPAVAASAPPPEGAPAAELLAPPSQGACEVEAPAAAVATLAASLLSDAAAPPAAESTEASVSDDWVLVVDAEGGVAAIPVTPYEGLAPPAPAVAVRLNVAEGSPDPVSIALGPVAADDEAAIEGPGGAVEDSTALAEGARGVDFEVRSGAAAVPDGDAKRGAGNWTCGDLAVASAQVLAAAGAPGDAGKAPVGGLAAAGTGAALVVGASRKLELEDDAVDLLAPTFSAEEPTQIVRGPVGSLAPSELAAKGDDADSSHGGPVKAIVKAVVSVGAVAGVVAMILNKARR